VRRCFEALLALGSCSALLGSVLRTIGFQVKDGGRLIDVAIQLGRCIGDRAYSPRRAVGRSRSSFREDETTTHERSWFGNSEWNGRLGDNPRLAFYEGHRNFRIVDLDRGRLGEVDRRGRSRSAGKKQRPEGARHERCLIKLHPDHAAQLIMACGLSEPNAARACSLMYSPFCESTANSRGCGEAAMFKAAGSRRTRGQRISAANEIWIPLARPGGSDCSQSGELALAAPAGNAPNEIRGLSAVGPVSPSHPRGYPRGMRAYAKSRKSVPMGTRHDRAYAAIGVGHVVTGRPRRAVWRRSRGSGPRGHRAGCITPRSSRFSADCAAQYPH
jgi:hypothetical protein